MKKYSSVWALLARSTIFKIAGILAGMAAVEWALLARQLKEVLNGRLPGQNTIPNGSPVYIWRESFAWIFFPVAILLVLAVLVWAEGKRKGSCVEYTWGRLQVSGWRLVALKTVYNVCVFGILFGAQLAVVLLFLAAYAKAVPEEMISPQMYFLSFMQSEYLHNILPFADPVKWVRNVLMTLAFGLMAARGIGEERAKNRNLVLEICFLSGVWFYRGTGSGVDIVAILVYGICILVDLVRVSGILEDQEESENLA